MHLRPATREDIPLLKHWDEQPHVWNSDPDTGWDWDNEIGKGLPGYEHFMAENQDKPIGFIQILDPSRDPTQYWGEQAPGYRAIDIWIGEAEYLRKGHGSQMMKLALARCFQDPKVTEVWVDPLVSNKGAHAFYQKLGFRFVEKRVFGEDQCAVFRLLKEDWLYGRT